jgi:hypothetical protein
MHSPRRKYASCATLSSYKTSTQIKTENVALARPVLTLYGAQGLQASTIINIVIPLIWKKKVLGDRENVRINR